MRFDFKDDYTVYRLNEICKRVTRKNKNIESTLPLTISAQYGLVDQITFFNKSVASSNLEGYYLLKNGEFAYNKSYSKDYPWGAIKRLDKYEQGCLSTLYICFDINKTCNSDYLVHYFESPKWYKQVSDIAGEGARNHGLLNISVDDFFQTKHRFPSLDEQVKVSKLLNLIETRIQTQNKIIEDYETLRNTINLQVIGKKDPNTKISECLDCFSSSKKESDILVSPEGDFPAFGANGLIRRIDKYDYQTSGISIVKDGAGVGKMYYLTGKYSIVGTQNLLQSKNGYNLVYLYYALQNFDFRKYIVGSGIPHIYFKDYKNESIYIPESKKMISTISKCLASIDTKITIEKGILNRLLKQKEYLLQNLFI